jgi:hypothetical protein
MLVRLTDDVRERIDPKFGDDARNRFVVVVIEMGS